MFANDSSEKLAKASTLDTQVVALQTVNQRSTRSKQRTQAIGDVSDCGPTTVISLTPFNPLHKRQKHLLNA